MEENREEIEGIMRRNGLTEKEARAAYHLNRAQDLFEEMYVEEPSASGRGKPWGQATAQLIGEVLFGIHFAALHRLLGTRVLQRDYPEGWGGRTFGGKEDEA